MVKSLMQGVWVSGWLAGAIVLGLASGVMAAPRDFDEAKRLAERVYSDHPEEFYCGCRITWRKDGKDLVDAGSCGYQVRKDPVRAQRIEWEHVVPASWFGQPMSCWKAGGRQNCSQHDPAFQRIEADLHNLTPAVGEVNGDRSNMPFGLVAAEVGRYGRCGTRVDRAADRVEPRDAVKGDVARIAFYMAERYHVTLGDTQLALLKQWAVQDPVDKWELERDKRVGQHMGWRNPYVAQAASKPLPALAGNGAGSNGSSVGSSVSSATPKPAGLKAGGGVFGNLPLNKHVTGTRPAAVDKPPGHLPAGNSGSVAGSAGKGAGNGAASNAVGGVRGNRNSKLYHFAHCPGYGLIKPENRVEFVSDSQARASGFHLAGNCKAR